MPRTLIYARTYEECADIYKKHLKNCFTEPYDAPDVSEFRLVELFCSVTDSAQKDKKQSHLRIVIATVDFGMGIDSPDIRHVIHVGLADDVESYIQQTGLCGRDGKPSHATLLTKK